MLFFPNVILPQKPQNYYKLTLYLHIIVMSDVVFAQNRGVDKRWNVFPVRGMPMLNWDAIDGIEVN